MPSDYGDLSRLAVEAELDVDEMRARLARMSAARCLNSGAPRPTCARRTRIWGSLRESRSCFSSRRCILTKRQIYVR
jgi:hypothetical protein